MTRVLAVRLYAGRGGFYSLVRNFFRRMSMNRCLLFAAIVTHMFFATASLAEDFRIETKVFVGDEEEPVSETTTLFYDQAVYDFLTAPEQIAVFRKAGGGRPGRFILLDPERRIRTELSTDQIAGAMNKLRNWAARQRDPFLKFA